MAAAAHPRHDPPGISGPNYRRSSHSGRARGRPARSAAALPPPVSPFPHETRERISGASLPIPIVLSGTDLIWSAVRKVGGTPEGAERVSELARRLGLVGGGKRNEQAVVDLGVGDGDADAIGGEGVAVGVREAAD